MKRLFFSAMVLLLAANMLAQSDYDWTQRRNSLSLTVGTPSFIAGTKGVFTALFSGNNSTTDLYGAYGIHYGYNVLKWLRVGGSATYSGWQMEKTKDDMTKLTKYHEATVLANVDFTYLNRKYVRLYSGAGLGVNLGYQRVTGEDKPTLDPYFAWNVTIFGVEAGGERVYAITDVNFGYAEWLKAGIGWRF